MDVDPASTGYGRLVGQTDMPHAGDELHHFGWNACSSCLCPYAPHPHMERRYLVVPGIHSSRIHILDTKPDPRQPKIVKVIEAETLAQRTGYAAPHTVHCGPDGIYMSALGAPDGDGPGGMFMLDPETFEVRGRWEIDRGPQNWPTTSGGTSARHDGHQHVGHAQHGEGRRESGAAAGGKYGHTAARVGPAPPAPRAGARPRRRAADGAGAAPGARPDTRLRVRGRRGVAQGSLGVDLAVVPREAGTARGKWAIKKVIEIPAEPADPEKLPPLLQGFKAVAPLVTDINLSLDDRYLYVSCWGTGEFIQYDVTDPFNPKKVSSIRLGGIVGRAAHPSNPEQPLNGGPQMVEISRDGKRIYFTNPSTRRGTSSSIRTASAAGWRRSSAARRRHGARLPVLPGDRRHAAAPGPARRRRRSSDSYCYA